MSRHNTYIYLKVNPYMMETKLLVHTAQCYQCSGCVWCHQCVRYLASHLVVQLTALTCVTHILALTNHYATCRVVQLPESSQTALEDYINTKLARHQWVSRNTLLKKILVCHLTDVYGKMFEEYIHQFTRLQLPPIMSMWPNIIKPENILANIQA